MVKLEIFINLYNVQWVPVKQIFNKVEKYWYTNHCINKNNLSLEKYIENI